MCEVGANLVHVRNTLERGNVDSLQRDVEETLLPRIRQLDTKISHVRSGLLGYPHRFSTSGRIEPVVCLIDGFPLSPPVRERIDAVIQREGLLAQENVGRLAIVSAEEMEFLCGSVEQHSSTMSALLREYSEDEAFRDYPITEFIRRRFRELPLTRLLSREFESVTDAVVAQIRPETAD